MLLVRLLPCALAAGAAAAALIAARFTGESSVAIDGACGSCTELVVMAQLLQHRLQPVALVKVAYT